MVTKFVKKRLPRRRKEGKKKRAFFLETAVLLLKPKEGGGEEGKNLLTKENVGILCLIYRKGDTPRSRGRTLDVIGKKKDISVVGGRI